MYIEIIKVIPSLKKSDRISYERLQNHLAAHGYVPAPKTPALWRHITHHISFMLCVDDFGIKYVGKQHLTHLLYSLKDQYDISIDWEGVSYCGLTIAWDYAKKYIDISIPGYINKALKWLKHPWVKNVEDATTSYNKPSFGAKQQWADNVSTEEILAPSDSKHVQLVVGTLLYYDIAVDNTMLVVLGDLEPAQKKLQL